MHSTLTGFSDLPTELILKILECLDYIDLLICQQVGSNDFHILLCDLLYTIVVETIRRNS